MPDIVVVQFPYWASSHREFYTKMATLPNLLRALCLHRGHGQDLAPLLALELSTYGTVDAGADGVSGLVEEDAGVIVESDDGSVATLGRVSGADDDGVADVTALDLVGGGNASHAGRGSTALFLDDDNDSVT